MLNSIFNTFHFLLDPQHTVVSMLVVLSILTFCVCLIPEHEINIVRSWSLAVTMVPLFWSLYLWMTFDASGHSLQMVVTLSPNWGSAPIYSAPPAGGALALHLSFGVDSVSLSLTVLTAALFPLCMMLMRTFAGFMTFLLLEIVILGALNVLDLLGFYILFEASLILLFLLIGRTPFGNIEAAYKIVLYTMVGSLLLLPVIFVMYSECGSTNLLYILCARDNVLSLERQNLLGWGLLAVFSVKIPLMPVHLWLPEAHVAAPTAGSVLLAGVLLKLGGIGFIRFMIPALPAFTANVFPLVSCMCLVSFLFSTLSTIRQIDLKKIVAYSSIAHMAVVTLAIFSQSEFSVYSSTFMMIAHGLVSPGLFLLVGLLYDRAHTKFLIYFTGLGAHMPVFSIIFLLLTLANLSFPLFPNFIAEVLCLASVFAVHELFAYLFCISQVLGAAYGFWAFNRIIHGMPSGLGSGLTLDLSRTEFHMVLPLMVGIFWLGLKPMA